VVGWSEYDESFGPPGISLAITRFADMIIGQDAMGHERIFAQLFAAKRVASQSVTALAAGAIENALLDAKARTLGIPCHQLLGGAVRDRVRLYWSHCASWQVLRPEHYGPPVRNLDDVAALGALVRGQGFGALKTNVILFEGDAPTMYGPGFARPFKPDLNMDRATLRQLRAHLEAFRAGAGPDMDLLLDLNFNAKPAGFNAVLKEIGDLDMFWIEIDCDSSDALSDIRAHSPFPIASCETFIGLRRFLPFFAARAMDVAIIDGVWNGMWQSMKIAAAAEAHEMNVAPHNFYGHLATMMNAHFSAAVPNPPKQ
jgi:L-alanine-DL-glutamate epimerase-like enolase superfamily enzyme